MCFRLSTSFSNWRQPLSVIQNGPKGKVRENNPNYITSKSEIMAIFTETDQRLRQWRCSGRTRSVVSVQHRPLRSNRAAQPATVVSKQPQNARRHISLAVPAVSKAARPWTWLPRLKAGRSRLCRRSVTSQRDGRARKKWPTLTQRPRWGGGTEEKWQT